MIYSRSLEKKITPYINNQLNCPVEWLEVIEKYQIIFFAQSKFGNHLVAGFASYGQTLLAWVGDIRINIEIKKNPYIMNKVIQESQLGADHFFI